MNNKFVRITAAAVLMTLLTGCVSAADTQNTQTAADENQQSETVVQETETVNTDGIELTVVTSYAGDDSNALNFQNAVDVWEAETGNIVVDNSREADEEFKARVIDDFRNGNEPDVLFFFTGDDASGFIEDGLVVSLEEIRALYPEYGSNMDEAKLPLAVDGEKYAIPVNGVWEALYVNKNVLKEAGVTVPDENYTWEQFLEDCEAIKTSGKVPIAASFGKVPHYWFEICVENYSGYENHLSVPDSTEAESFNYWVKALYDMKALYTNGYLPSNTIYSEESSVFDMFVNDEAAFLLDGSWRMDDIARSCCLDSDDLSTLDTSLLEEKFTVTYVPAKEARSASDLVGGCTMGYYITRRAWEDEDKRAAAVDFIQSMTTDAMIAQFAGVGAHALKIHPEVDTSQLNSLQLAGYELVSGASSWTNSVISNMHEDCAEQLLKYIPQVIQSWYMPESAVSNCVYVMQSIESEELAQEQAQMQESETTQY